MGWFVNNKNGTREEVAVAVSTPDDVNTGDVNEKAFSAINRGDVTTLERALNDGADPLAKNEHNYNMLSAAVFLGEPVIVEYLLENTSNEVKSLLLTAITRSGQTPLQLAQDRVINIVNDNPERMAEIVRLLSAAENPDTLPIAQVIEPKTQGNVANITSERDAA